MDFGHKRAFNPLLLVRFSRAGGVWDSQQQQKTPFHEDGLSHESVAVYPMGAW